MIRERDFPTTTRDHALQLAPCLHPRDTAPFENQRQGGRTAMSRILWAFVGACVVTVGLSAQSYPQGQGGATPPDRQPPSTQAPPAAPPATPAPPTSTQAGRATADKKVTFSGCIERQPASAAAVTGAPTMPFMLTNASAGASAPVATSGAASASKVSYRLDGTESTLTPHVGHKVEITGTVEERPASAAGGASASANAPAGTLKVDSVKMVSTTCP